VFLLTLPLAVIALLMALKFVPSHVNESTEPVDSLGGVLSIFMIGALILGINFLPVPNETTLVVVLFVVAGGGLVAFFLRQKRAPNPLYVPRTMLRMWPSPIAGSRPCPTPSRRRELQSSTSQRIAAMCPGSAL
jgi:DHA2 family multidrug resistance protein-like MFS transporter